MCTVNHNKLYYSHHYVLHVSVSTDHPQVLITCYLKLKIKCIYAEFVVFHKLNKCCATIG